MNYAKRQRHLPPYCENPFATLGIGSIPIEDAKPTVVFTGDEERALLESSDDWLFPIMLTLIQTGMRPRELVHLLLPDDIDLEDGWIHIHNKRQLGWMVKTRRERSIPITPELVRVLTPVIGSRNAGPVFRQRRCQNGHTPLLDGWNRNRIEAELVHHAEAIQEIAPDLSTRKARKQAANTIWRDLGAVKYDYLRNQFVRLMKKIDRPDITTIKTCRHNFATCLQDANVDPLIRNELLGHSPAGLGMTTRYTQTRPETKKRQLLAALLESPSSRFVRDHGSWAIEEAEFIP
jgi:integrase